VGSSHSCCGSRFEHCRQVPQRNSSAELLKERTSNRLLQSSRLGGIKQAESCLGGDCKPTATLSVMRSLVTSEECRRQRDLQKATLKKMTELTALPMRIHREG